MALQMPVYREISAIESKVFMGLSWRQLLAAVLLAIVCGGGYAGLVLGIGMDCNTAMYLVFIPGVPIEMPSLIVIVPKTCGIRPMRLPSLTAAFARSPRLKLHGVIVL